MGDLVQFPRATARYWVGDLEVYVHVQVVGPGQHTWQLGTPKWYDANVRTNRLEEALLAWRRRDQLFKTQQEALTDAVKFMKLFFSPYSEETLKRR